MLEDFQRENGKLVQCCMEFNWMKVFKQQLNDSNNLYEYKNPFPTVHYIWNVFFSFPAEFHHRINNHLKHSRRMFNCMITKEMNSDSNKKLGRICFLICVIHYASMLEDKNLQQFTLDFFLQDVFLHTLFNFHILLISQGRLATRSTNINYW